MRCRAAGRYVVVHFAVKKNQTDGVVLVQHQVRQCRSGVQAVVQFAPVLSRLERHRFRRIHEDRAAAVGLLLEQFDVVLVRFCEKLPVDRADLVADRVWPVVGVLRTGAVVGTRVKAGEVPFNGFARDQLHARNESEGFGVDQAIFRHVAAVRVLFTSFPAAGESSAGSRRRC